MKTFYCLHRNIRPVAREFLIFYLFFPQDPVLKLGQINVPSPMKIRFVLVFAFLLFASRWTSAQVVSASDSGTIAGIVKDEAGNPMAGAVITATRLDDSTTRTTVSGIDGSYKISVVLPGMYSVMAEKEGFSQVVVSSLAVSASKT